MQVNANTRMNMKTAQALEREWNMSMTANLKRNMKTTTNVDMNVDMSADFDAA